MVQNIQNNTHAPVVESQREFASSSYLSPPESHKPYSTLQSCKARSCFGSIFSLVSWPFVKIGQLLAWIGTKIRDHILCCCFSAPREKKLDWQEVKDIFTTIYASAITDGGDPADRQKRFASAYAELPEAGKQRFHEHIGFALASRQDPPQLDRADQEKWFKESKDKIDFQSQFISAIKNNMILESFNKAPNIEVLKEAVENFQHEINEKTK